MPEDNERSIKARRISHLRKQMRKRATVSSGDTSGKPGSGSAEQPGWQRQLSAIRQSLRANTELGAATVDQETIRKSQDEALDVLEALAKAFSAFAPSSYIWSQAEQFSGIWVGISRFIFLMTGSDSK